jgi:hypothetical protein
MGDMAQSFGASLLCIFLMTLSIFAQAPFGWYEFNGKVIDQTGAAIAGATVVASGVGFKGWASTGPDGSFHLNAAGLFISVRSAGMEARLLRKSELNESVPITLKAAGQSVRQMPACSSLSEVGTNKKWIGGGLKVDPGLSAFNGPVSGEHDSHWYVTHGEDTLHIVDGYAWHAGLPLEDRLANSGTISVRSWEFDNIVGLDLSGKAKNGKRWRWLGAPVAQAIEYTDVTQESAEYFDRIIETTCFGSGTSRNDR